MPLISHDDDVVNFSPEDDDCRKVQPVLQAELAKAKTLSRLRQYSTTSTLPEEDEDERRRRQYSSTTTLPEEDEVEGRRRQYSRTTVSDGDVVDRTSPVCCQCSQSKPSVKCSHCSTLFCKRCFVDVHGGVKAFASHKGLPLDYFMYVDLQKCPDHSRILGYWCDQDREAVCDECALLGNHKGHKVQKLQERNSNVIKEMETIYPLASNVLEALMKSRKLAFDFPKTQIEKIKEEADTYFQEQLSLLNMKQKEVNLKIEDIGNKVTKDSNDIIAEIDSKADDLQRWLKRSQHCLSNNLTKSVIDENGNKLDITELSQNLKIYTGLNCCLSPPILSVDLSDLTFNYKPPKLESIGVNGIADLAKIPENECKNLTNPQSSENDARMHEYSNPQIDKSSKTEQKEVTSNNDSIQEDMKHRKVIFQEVPLAVSNLEFGEWVHGQWGKVERVTTPKFHRPPGTARVVTFKTVEAATSCLDTKNLKFEGNQLKATLFLTKEEKSSGKSIFDQGIRGNWTKIYKMSIYCTNLPKYVTGEELKNHMIQFGYVQFVRISTNRSGFMYGIIEFLSEEGKLAAIKEKTHMLRGKHIKVQSYGDRCTINLSIKKDNSMKVSKSDANGPLSSSTPLNSSVCEVSKAEYKTIDKVDIDIEKSSDCIQKVAQEMPKNCESDSHSDIDEVKQLTLSELINTKHEETTLKADGVYCGWGRHELPKTTSLEVQITHIDDKGTFWVLPITDIRKLQSITKELTNYCENLISRPDQTDWSPGERAVMFHDGFYKRVEIIEVTSEKSGCRVTAVLVDNGMKVECGSGQLLVAPDEGLAFHNSSLALPVRLYGVAMRSPLGDSARLELLGKMRQRKSTLTQAWMADEFPLPGVLRYRNEQGSDGGNLAEDFIKLKIGKLVTSFRDWEEDIGLSGLDWMLNHEGSSPPCFAIPSTIPLRSGLWLPVSTETLDFENNLLGLHPRFSQDKLSLNRSFVDFSLIETCFASFLLRKSKYQKAAESSKERGLPEEGDNVLVFSFDEWHRGVVQAHGSSDGPLSIYLPDFHFLDTFEEVNIKKMPVGTDWHLDPVQVIKAGFLLKGNESSDEIEILRDMLEFRVDFVELVSVDDEKQEVVGHFYDKHLNLII